MNKLSSLIIFISATAAEASVAAAEVNVAEINVALAAALTSSSFILWCEISCSITSDLNILSRRKSKIS